MRIHLLFFGLLFSSTLFCQDPVIIGDPVQGGYNMNFQDTLITGQHWNGYSYDCDGGYYDESYYFDLDHDGAYDLLIEMDCYWGSMGNSEDIRITPLGDFWVIQDTTYQDSVQTLSPTGTVIDTVETKTIVKRFGGGDTIYDNLHASTEPTILHDVSEGGVLWLKYSNVNVFYMNTAYFGMYKELGADKYIYYIKVLLQMDTWMDLQGVWSNELFSTTESIKKQRSFIFPNPARDKIRIQYEGQGEIYTVYNLVGKPVKEFNVQNQQLIDVSGLKRGTYIIRSKEKSQALILY